MHSFDDAYLFIDDPDAQVLETTDLYDITPTLLDLMNIYYDLTEFDGASLV